MRAKKMSSLVRRVDVALLGGGPAGCATASALANYGLSVAVLERSDYDNVRVGETLPPEVRFHLRNLGLWDQFVRGAPRASLGIRYVWGQTDVHQSDSFFNSYGTGWHVDRRYFDAMLARATQKAGAYILTAASRTSCSEGRMSDWEIRAGRGGKQFIFHAEFLVDATGRASTLARKRGAGRIFYDRLVGVVVFFRALAGNGPGDYTFVEAVEDGWWYSALLPNSRLVVAYMTDADLNARASGRLIQYWQKQIAKTTHTKVLIDSCALESGPLIVAANSSKLNTLFDRNWLAVGDAAAAFDPLSSQGVYKALESGIRAARAIRNHFGGDGTALRGYAGEIEASFHHYLLLRKKYYGLEGRWPHSPFWRRRQLESSLKGY